MREKPRSRGIDARIVERNSTNPLNAHQKRNKRESEDVCEEVVEGSLWPLLSKEIKEKIGIYMLQKFEKILKWDVSCFDVLEPGWEWEIYLVDCDLSGYYKVEKTGYG